jgi:hypothetical protein
VTRSWFSVGIVHDVGKLTLLIGLRNEPRLELDPLLTSELNLATKVIREDDFFWVREVDRGATALDAAQLDNALFGHTLRCHDDTPFCKRSEAKCIVPTKNWKTQASVNPKLNYHEHIDTSSLAVTTVLDILVKIRANKKHEGLIPRACFISSATVL